MRSKTIIRVPGCLTAQLSKSLPPQLDLKRVPPQTIIGKMPFLIDRPHQFNLSLYRTYCCENLNQVLLRRSIADTASWPAL